jgi:hypothetical protein
MNFTPLQSDLPIQDVKIHKNDKAQLYSIGGKTRLRQYIGGIIIYFLKTQDELNLRIFWEVHLQSFFQKVN